MPLSEDDEGAPTLHRERQIRYWLRCLKTYLPSAYTSNDSNRMTLAFFTIAALDVLDVLTSHTTPAERAEYTDWIYHCQHPSGGFRGFPATDFGARATPENAVWDPANLPATFFALTTLMLLRDDMKRVKRRECLDWVRRLQRPDGSFGDLLGEGGKIEGARDTRFCNLAAGVRWILRGTEESDAEEDIDVDQLVRYLRSTETYDGGISDAPFTEAHAGFAYCGISALTFLDRLPPSIPNPYHRLRPSHPDNTTTKTTSHPPLIGLTSPSHTIHWLLSRQTATLSEPSATSTLGDESDTPATCHDAHTFLHSTTPSVPLSEKEVLSSNTNSGPKDEQEKQRLKEAPTAFDGPEIKWAGFNGRCNKIADTCYSFWVGACLAMLNQIPLLDISLNRNYLLEKTQHRAAGGFGKLPGDLPDIMHSYLALAALSLLGLPGLAEVDPALGMGKGAREWLVRHAEWWIRDGEGDR
ncbi:MAG: hypothetical protein M1819_002245 [Sarea resinae]|nr:MAG: hypothetical protein M1819_002245 [Sarea resinae]